ncbi:MAG: maltotransferase domain-containing protein [Actinomycetes bacterium]
MSPEPRPPSRIVITDVSPVIDAGKFPIKRVVGEPVKVTATVFADGHDPLRVVVSHRISPSTPWVDTEMHETDSGLARWEATFVPHVEGTHTFAIRAWVTASNMEANPDATDRWDDVSATESNEMPVLVERERALFSTWYELFPRSLAGPAKRFGNNVGMPMHGTLRDVVERLEEFAELGIDVLYLPPIHPIGSAFRKGPNNTESANSLDPGSPWAIGSSDGGHRSVHPELGTVADLADLAQTARRFGIDVALDLAFQCSPDHPWVTEHPEWFRHRADGTIQYAENPPKKYQDIYPLDFDCHQWMSLWEELRAVTLFWCEQGIRTFRVDNPHTKPFPFWEWLIAQVREVHPDAIFLAEAFTMPMPMRRLGQIGFAQSYTYFTWRTTKTEIVDYFTELAAPPSVDEFRPNVWPTTPDILPANLQHAPLEAFASRLLLAATLSPSFGVYGPSFELGENLPLGEGSEEFNASEKYEVRRWDLSRQRTLRPLLGELNRIRRDQLALHTLRTLRFHHIDNDMLLCFSKTAHSGPSVEITALGQATMIVVANLDPTERQIGTVELDLEAIGLDADRPFVVEDLLGGEAYVWNGKNNFIDLDPARQPGHMFRVTQPDETVDLAGPLKLSNALEPQKLTSQ